MAELRLGTSARKLDADAITLGRKVECPMRPGLTVSILPAQRFNRRYQQAQQAFVMNALADQKSQQDAEKDFPNRLTDPEFVVDALVADMDGLYDANGKKVKYTRERGITVLGDPGNADVLLWIVEEALERGAYYMAAAEEVGNS